LAVIFWGTLKNSDSLLGTDFRHTFVSAECNQLSHP